MRRKTAAADHVAKGNAFFDNDNLPSAIASYTAAVKASPNNVEALGNRANAHAELQQYELSLADSGRVVDILVRTISEQQTDEQIKPLQFNLSVTYYTRAECFFNLEKFYDALACCDAAINLRPRFREALCVRGATHNALFHYSAALKDLDASLSMGSHYPIGLRHRGIAHCMLEKYHLAVADLTKCMKFDPLDTVAKKWKDRAEAELRAEALQTEKLAKELMGGDESDERKAGSFSAHSPISGASSSAPAGAPPPDSAAAEEALEALESGDQVHELQAGNSTGSIIRKKVRKKKSVSSSSSSSSSPMHEKVREPPTTTFTFPSDVPDSAGGSTELPYESPFDNDNDSVSSASSLGLSKSLEHDLFCIEVAAFVDTVVAVGTASVMGRQHNVNEQMCLAVALQMQKQTKIGLLRALREQYIEEHMSKIFQNIQVEALVETAIAVGTASIVGRIMAQREAQKSGGKKAARGGGDAGDNEETIIYKNAASNMVTQTRFGLIRMKQQFIEDNIRHVFKNVPASVASTGRRFSWSHHSSNSHSRDVLEVMRNSVKGLSEFGKDEYGENWEDL
jgi:tetratricopeptide (TPR) repeat protein